VAPAMANRAGGYTRIVKLGQRISDSSEMCILEWVAECPYDEFSVLYRFGSRCFHYEVKLPVAARYDQNGLPPTQKNT
ncbi:MAG: L17 family ribosomal protein, partial [Clostridiales bacterium]|nr:L17 family ribosomal protein [Clostridiales bacterium]